MNMFTNLKQKNIFVFILSIIILFSLPCVAYAEVDFADNVLTSGIEIQIKANVDPGIQGDILVWVTNLDDGTATYTTLYAHNNYFQTIYVKDEGNYQISSVSYNGMFASDYQVEYKKIEVVSGITNHLIFSIGNPVTNEEVSAETSSESGTNEMNTPDKTDSYSYSETVFEEYCDESYSDIFSGTTCYEDNILIVFLTTENNNEYYTMAWVGENIKPEIVNMFGNENTELGYAMKNKIEEDYSESLGENLASVIDYITDSFSKLNLKSSSYIEPSDKSSIAVSCVYNDSECKISENILNKALENFNDKSDISLCIVVEDAKDVFSEQKTSENESFNDIDNSQQVDEEKQKEDVIAEDDSSSSRKGSISTDLIIGIIGIVIVIGATIAFSVFWLKRSKK